MIRIQVRSSLRARQNGTTLIVALVLLLLATLLGLFAVNVGMFAQRTSAADLRTRLVHQTLEGAISRAAEYVVNNATLMDSTNSVWTLCGAADTTFPCGTIPQCATGAVSGSGCTNSAYGRRGNMYAYKTPSASLVDVNNDGDTTDQFDKYSLPIGSTSTTSNGFTVRYNVGALMCMVKKPTLSTDPTECTIDSTKAQGTYLLTVTAVGNIDGEATNNTLSTTFAMSPAAPGAGNAPTLVASGSMDLTGNGTFVPNPNAAGNGMPITVWTPSCVKQNGAGTVNTCYAGDWMRATSGTFSYASNSDGSTSSVLTCTGNGNKACSCTSTNSISQGNGGLIEGIDVLSNDSTANGCKSDPPVYGTSNCTTASNCKANYDVDQTEFPCDLFQYIFGTQAWDDKAVQTPATANTACTEAGASAPSGGGDCFCEYHRPTNFTVADGSSQSMGADEAFLYGSAKYIYDTTSSRSTWATTAQSASSCDDLFTKINAQGGLVWDRTGTCLNNTTLSQIGYPDKPVMLVSDGSATLQGETMFGMLFVRDTTQAGSSTPNWGGAANFTANSTGVIYGSVIVQGTVSRFNGSAGVIYNGTVIAALRNTAGWYTAYPVPGGWTDRYAY